MAAVEQYACPAFSILLAVSGLIVVYILAGSV